MKQIFKKALALTVCLSLITAVIGTTVKAEKLGDMVVDLTEDQVSVHEGGLVLHKQEVATPVNGVRGDKLNNHTVQWIDFKPSDNLKVVTYSGNYKDNWHAYTTRQAASAWERENPGWKVVAGINGDFFAINGTKEPTNNFMQGGDMYRPTGEAGSHRGNIGWKSNGEVKVGFPEVSSKMSVKVINQNNEVLNELPIETYNSAPSATGITLLTKDFRAEQDLTGYTVIKGLYSICRIDSCNAVFVKGTLDSKLEGTANMAAEKGEFYLASKDGSLDSLELGSLVKCEYSFTGEWKDVQNTMGYIHKVMENGACDWIGSNDGFAKTTHPRTIIGFKPDGSTVFLVSNGRGTEAQHNIGLSFGQAAAILDRAGVTDAYNLDGGGSSTLIVRNEYGGFDVINDPSDGNERSDGNHVLVVQRDPGFKIEAKNVTYNSAKIGITVTNQELFDVTKNISINVNGKDYELKDASSEALVTGLTAETSYKIQVNYTGKSVYDINEDVDDFFYQQIETEEYSVPVTFEIENVYKQQFDVVKKGDFDHSLIQDVILNVNGKEYKMDDKDRITIGGLEGDSVYNISITFNLLDKDSGIKYPGKAADLAVRTLNFELPTIVRFEQGGKTEKSLSISYKYDDWDNCVTEAYILHNGEKIAITSKSGREMIKDLDFEHTDNTFQLVLVVERDGKTYTVKSDELKYQKTAEDLPEPTPTPEPEKKGCGCGKKGNVAVEILTALSLVSVIYLKRREH